MIYKEVTLVFLKSGHSHNARDSLTSKLKKPLADGAVYDLHTIVDKFNNVHNKETTTPTKTMTNFLRCFRFATYFFRHRYKDLVLGFLLFFMSHFIVAELFVVIFKAF